MQLNILTNTRLQAAYFHFLRGPAPERAGPLSFSVRAALAALLLLGATLLGTGPTMAQTYDPNGITVAGRPTSGTAANRFNIPTAVFVDGAGNIFVADGNNHRIQKFPPNSTSLTSGTTVAGGNGQGSAADRLNSPSAVFVDGMDNIFVADQSNHRIQKFPPNSTSLTSGTTVAGGNSFGTAADRLNKPSAVFVDRTGNIFVADFDNHRIQKFPPNSTSATSGTTVAGRPTSGTAANLLNNPIGVFVDGTDNIFVADAGNHRIQQFPPNSTSLTNGTTVAGTGTSGTAANRLNRPVGVFVDGTTGNLFVAEFGNSRIQQFPPNSTSLTNGTTVAGSPTSGSAANQLNLPFGVFVDGTGNLFVADAFNHRIQKFLVTAPACSSVAYVTPTGGASTQDGSSWTNAYAGTALQTAINAVSACQGTVYVASGLYQPGGSGNSTRATSFSIASGVRVLGGYDGSGTPGTRTAFPSSSTLTGGNQSYHVVFMQNVAAGTTLDGFVITGGLADGTSAPDNQGGGIFSRALSGNSSPTLQNLVITGNTASSGGGIYTRLSSLTATNSLIQSNTATSTDMGDGGGGLYADGGSSNLSSLTVTGNRAASGGGINATFNSLTVVNSLLQSNTATEVGGGLMADGGSSNLSSLTVTGNRADFAGGIYSQNSLTATSSLIQSNTATTSGGGFVAEVSNSNLSSLTVTGNIAGSNGGGIWASSSTLTAANSLIQSNTATTNGGGLFASGGTSNLSSLTVTGNTASEGGGMFTSLHSLTAINSLLQSNTATNTFSGGGGLYAGGGSSNLSSLTVTANIALNGGGVYANSHTLGATNSLFQSNTATTNGGGLFASGGTSNLSSLTVTGNSSLNGGGIYTDNSSLTATTSLIQSNTAVFGGGGLFADRGRSNLNGLTIRNNSASNGGGINGSNSHTLTATNSLLQGNSAMGSSGGGGLYASGSTSNLSSLTLTGNTARNGGGIYTGSSSLTATNSLIQSNTATNGGTTGGDGGGFYTSGGSSNLSSLTVSGNRASNGGGISTSSHTLVAANSLFQSNTATSNGGGLLASGGSSNLSSLTIMGNTASNNGGGINISTSHTITATNTLIQSNTATTNGGGLLAFGGSSNLSSLTVAGNTAIQGVGGGISSELHSLTATNSLLKDNIVTATNGGGGGLFAQGGSNNLSSVTVTANRAGFAGGLYVAVGSLTVTNSVLQSNTATSTVSGGGLRVEQSTGQVVNSLLEGNVANSSGGAVAVAGNISSLTLTNATLRNNTAPQGAAISTATNGRATLVNSIVWGNGTPANAISASPDVQATYSLFETGTTGFISDPTNITTATSPFANAAGPELATTSEAIDAGNNAAPGLVTSGTDLVGQPRLANCSVDLGAVESQGSATVVIATQPAASSVVCEGRAVSTSVVARGSNLSYQWYKDGSPITSQTAATFSLSAATTSDTGDYSVVVTRACPTEVASATSTSFSLTVGPAPLTFAVLPTANGSPGSGTLTCAQTSLTLTATTDAANTLTWSTSPPTATTSIVVSTSGVYSVTVSASNSCTNTASVTVVANQSAPANPVLAGLPSATLSCGQSSVTLTASPTGQNLRYTFADASGPLTSASTTNTLAVSTAGLYSVTITDVTSGCSSTVTTTVETTTAVVTVNLGASNTLTCAQTTATLSATATGTGSLTYTFRGGALPGTPSAASSVAVSQGGNYTVLVTDATGCTNTAMVTVQSNTAAPTPSISGNLAICQGAATTLTASGAGVGGSYRWTNNETTAAIIVNIAATFSVTVTNAQGCTATTNRTTTLRSLPTVSIAALPGFSVCPGQAVTLTANATAGTVQGLPRIATQLRPNTNEEMLNVGPTFSYTWSTGSSLRTTSFTPTATTQVSVQVSDGFCTSPLTTTTVTLLAAPVVSIGTSAPGFGCGVTSVTLTANVPTGATIQWLDDNSTTSPRAVTAVGTYGLSATATNGCSATATPVNLGQGSNTLPTVTLVFNNSATVMGQGNTATITVPGTPGQQFQVLGGTSYEYVSVVDRINGYEIRQKDFSSTGVFEIKRTGPFSITVYDSTGCSRTVQGVIEVK